LRSRSCAISPANIPRSGAQKTIQLKYASRISAGMMKIAATPVAKLVSAHTEAAEPVGMSWLSIVSAIVSLNALSPAPLPARRTATLQRRHELAERDAERAAEVAQLDDVDAALAALTL
jgi:hypothetical protein